MSDKEEIQPPRPPIIKGIGEEELEQIRLISEAEDQKDFLAQGNYGYPITPERYSLIEFFKEIFSTKEYHKISRTGYLKEFELGYIPISMRKYLREAIFCEKEGYDFVSEYLRDCASNIASTSLSRKGFFIKTSVTQKKESTTMGAPTSTTKEGIFGSTTTTTGIQE